MTHAEFQMILRNRITKMQDTLDAKANEYATEDRLHNFKAAAKLTKTWGPEALQAAIAADPDEDTVRLAYADWLEENGRFEMMRCPVCTELDDHPDNPWRGQPGHRPEQDPASGRHEGGWTNCKSCNCGGADYITAGWVKGDDLHERHAELIRVQCELERIDAGRMASGKSGFRTKKLRDRFDALRLRADALLPALLARLMPQCPCESGCGLICPGTLVRGFPVCEIPLVAVGREEIACKACGTTTVSGYCSKCNTVRGGDLADRIWQSTPWAIAAKFERGAMFQPAGLKPQESKSFENWRGFDWHDLGQLSSLRDSSSSLPTTLFRKVATMGRSEKPTDCYTEFPTEPAALSALSIALSRLTRPAPDSEEDP